MNKISEGQKQLRITSGKDGWYVTTYIINPDGSEVKKDFYHFTDEAVYLTFVAEYFD